MAHTVMILLALCGMGLLFFWPAQASADNPIVQTSYTADPAPMVWNDTLYIYTSHDLEGSTWFTMPDWRCYATTDMKNYTDLGAVMSATDFSWGEVNTAWAAQCIERNGKFYFYVTVTRAAGGGRCIGVAVADSPAGPFRDALGKPLCGPNWDYIDPTVFIDDDGQAYLYFGNPQLYFVRLNEDMISCSGRITKVPMTQEAFGTRPGGDERHQTLYEEGPWFCRRGGLYYMLYAASGIPENICYSTSEGPTGRYTFRGVIMPTEGGSFTNHCGVMDYRGHSYFFYHNGQLPGGGGFTRSVAVEEFAWREDGTIPEIRMTREGPAQLEWLSPYDRVEAETICYSQGVRTERCARGGMNLCRLQDGGYVKVAGVDFASGAERFTACVASGGEGGVIELRLDGVDGTLIGSCAVTNTGGWQEWQEASCRVGGAQGVHDLYLVFRGPDGGMFGVDWWQFAGKEK
ncbi:MAG: family 43 glycosylhydrolase [Clostridia bacterium]|nr:family 43 glycosylhydrolase [Clostridia bacterium]